MQSSQPASMHRAERWSLVIETAAAVFAFGALLVVILLPSRPRLWSESLGDFKMLYASAAGLAHSGNPYSFDELARAFQIGGVVRPASWFGHSPVYPFFTLLTVSPFLLLPIVPAAYLWACLSYLVMTWTAIRLVRYAASEFGLPLVLRLLVIALMASSGLVNFGLELGNPSVPAACFCLLAVTRKPGRGTWIPAIGLTLALLLKPHLALWVAGAMLFLPSRPASSEERAMALRALALFTATVLVMAAFLAWRQPFLPLLEGNRHMLHIEAVGGSMDPHDHGTIIIPAQITALRTLLGYWIGSSKLLLLLPAVFLLPLSAVLIRTSLRISHEWKPVLVSAWFAFGMLVTYHRAHDGIVLFLLLPWIMARLRQRLSDALAWTLFLLYLMFSIDLPIEVYENFFNNPVLGPIGRFLLSRQVALAALLLALTLIGFLWRAALLTQDRLPQKERRHGTDVSPAKQ